MSPTSNVSKCRHSRPAEAPRIASANAPSVWLPLLFIMAGLAALCVTAGWLVAEPTLITRYHYGAHAVAFTHVMLLGFALSVLMGVLYQLTPVALDAPLHSERLARWHWWLHVVGVTGMVVMFVRWDMRQLGFFGTVFGLGVGLFVYNMARTLARVPRWTPVVFGIASSVGWLLLTLLMGLFLVCVKCWPWISPFLPMPQMHAHAHIGVLGIFILLIVGVSYRLVPMFAISTAQNTRRAWASLVLLNAGVAALGVTILFQSSWKFAAALTVIAGLALYGLEVCAILRVRKRVALDWGIRSFLAGIALFAPLSCIALVLCWPGLPVNEHILQCENVYAVLAIFGVLWMTLLGVLYKILPFYVWFRRYSSDIGRREIPQLPDLYSTRLQAAGCWLHFAGVLCAGSAAASQNISLARAAAVLLAASVLTVCINAIRIVSHLWRKSPPLPEPDASPLPA